MSQAIDLSIWPEKFCPSVPYAWLRHERKILGICTCNAWLFYSTLLPWEFFYAKLRHFTMDHFRVPRSLCFKTGVGTQRLIWKSFFILIHSHSFSYYIRTEQSWVTVYKEYCQSGGQKIPAGKKSSKEKTQQEIWVGSMAHALKSPSYEDYTAGSSLPTFVEHVFQQAR